MTDTLDEAGRTLFGATGLRISRVGIGTAAWGTSAPLYGLTVSEEDAVRTALRVFDSPINLLDTSNNYGDGESERRIGIAIAERGGLPDGFILQTKLDRDPDSGAFDPNRMWRSLEESLTRLGLQQIPVLYLHDPEHSTFEDLTAPGGAIDALVAMRDEKLAAHIGISGGPVSLLDRFVATGLFEALITHNRWTLVDGRAGRLIDAAAAHGVGVANAAVYGGGLLAAWPRSTDRYHYRTAVPDVLAAVDAMGRLCAEYDVPLAAAALHASITRQGVGTTIVGAVSAAQVEETLALSATVLPAELVAGLAALRPEPALWIAD